MESEAEKAEEAGKRGDTRTLYEITRELSGRFRNTSKPVRNETGGLLRSAEEEMHRWREHFQTVLNPITESRPLKHVGRKKWGTQDDLRAPQRFAVAFGSL